jgi:hypothetical protein
MLKNHLPHLASPTRRAVVFKPSAGSAHRADRKLLTDLSRQPIVDLGVTRDGSFRAIGWIGVYRMTATLAIQAAPMM